MFSRTCHLHSQNNNVTTTSPQPRTSHKLQPPSQTTGIMSSAPLRSIEQPGLRWEEHAFHTEPVWTKEPSVEVIKTLVIQHLDLTGGEVPQTSFFAKYALNKLYAINCTKGRFIFRATLPVAPTVKTRSEIATLAFVREKTTIPVPQILAYDADLHNELGFEWIIMERVDARPLQEVWHQISWDKKQQVVTQVADFTAQLFRIEMSSIGSLYFANQGDSSATEKFEVGEIVLPTSFRTSNITLPVNRGPYTTARSCINAYVTFAQHFASKLDLNDEDNAKHYEDIQAVLSGINTVLPTYFPENEKEDTMLSNPDISMWNVLVTDTGDLVSILNWECCAVLPRAWATQLPRFLCEPDQYEVRDRPEDPSSEEYKDYLGLLARYEKTRLRAFFLEEMKRIAPQWMQIYETGRKKLDLLLTLRCCQGDPTVMLARRWVTALAEGREPGGSLEDWITGWRREEWRTCA